MLELYETAEELGVEIFIGNIPNTVSMCLPGYIALDFTLVEDGCEERCACAHELGHCARNAFYRREDPLYIKRRCENKADKWAIKKLVPKDKFMNAVRSGYTETWQIAEYFNVTEEFAHKATWYYRNGNTAW